jgi:hypothetical protein
MASRLVMAADVAGTELNPHSRHARRKRLSGMQARLIIRDRSTRSDLRDPRYDAAVEIDGYVHGPTCGPVPIDDALSVL